MSFERSDLDKISKLARLSLTEAEKVRFQKEIDKIVDFVKTLNEVDVENVSPLYYPLENNLSLKPDEPTQTLGLKALISSKGYEEGLIRVPRIIE